MNSPESLIDFYIAGPLFNIYEQVFQQQIETAIAELGSTFLPQRDCPQDEEKIFSACIDAVDRSRYVIANLSGIDVDSGTAFEVGYAYAKGIPVFAIRSEIAVQLPDRTIFPNVMLRDSVKVLAASIEELVDAIQSELDAIDSGEAG
ncbi:nucleoside 2-deoxyribosyltransferase [Synechococcus sp. PCC 7336]|uniref:nucleoside 2-deoxyribosyltransferase n=1 Tax=Synechococcus sp. PCC 7336 TaxID=195250 RepID=UPI00034B3600|nr:nucleoside 2-deoxyribosyltransferase [Synechococcus sp. PCC 7336]